MVAIKRLAESGVLEGQSPELKALAKARAENTEKSLQELADILKISKSCLNHRMRRLMELAEKTSNGNKTETKE